MSWSGSARTPADTAGGPEGLEVRLGPMRRRHLRSVMRIESQSQPRPWTSRVFRSELDTPETRCYLVARVDGAVVGYAGLMVVLDEAHVTNIAVDPAWRRHGIAIRLLVTLARVAVERGAAHLTLEVRVGNVGAQELYRRFGFAPAGVRKNYYAESNEDALVMWAHDIATPDYAARLERLLAEAGGTTVIDPAVLP